MIQSLNDMESMVLIDSGQKVMLFLYANWCGSCRLFRPKYEKISNKEEFAGIQFLSLNSEDCPMIRKRAGVNALPFFAGFHKGHLIDAFPTLSADRVLTLTKTLSEIAS